MAAPPDYLRIYAALDERREQSEGGPPQHFVALSQLGRAFTQTVFRGDQLFTLRDVAGILNMRPRELRNPYPCKLIEAGD
jgi:hypothetical protein